MKKIVDVIALERELENRLDVLNADTVFMSSSQAQSKLNGLIERLQLVRLIKKNFEIIEWLVGETDITRVDLINQDKV
jgi:hypothetical protein|tara:strand:- start:1967 stop:2200 length:234 start_codon:yes stop_codon:yes gene_type:complete